MKMLIQHNIFLSYITVAHTFIIPHKVLAAMYRLLEHKRTEKKLKKREITVHIKLLLKRN